MNWTEFRRRLMDGFSWHESTQGAEYWGRVYDIVWWMSHRRGPRPQPIYAEIPMEIPVDNELSYMLEDFYVSLDDDDHSNYWCNVYRNLRRIHVRGGTPKPSITPVKFKFKRRSHATSGAGTEKK